MKILYCFLAVLVGIISTSCSTISKVNIQGNPGTQIYYPSPYGPKNAGTIPASGILKLKIKDKQYHAFLLSKETNSNYYVPFALNYKHDGHLGTRIAEGAGITMAGIGLVGITSGVIALCVDSENSVGPALAGSGLALGGLGASFGVPATRRMEQDIYEYQIKYLATQSTNENIPISLPIFDEQYYVDNKDIEHTQKLSEESEVSNIAITSEKVNKSISNPSSKIVGIYLCHGTLSLKKEAIESYDTMKISISRKTNKTYEVSVITEFGESFFGMPSEYQLIENKNGIHILKNTKIPQASIIINNSGKIEYSHPRVNIDGVIYSLNISGQKE